jgi:ATP-dependent DNA ligase
MAFPIAPPVDPMLAKLATALPDGEGWLFEPKWDGFRAIVFRDGDEVYIQSRDLKPLDRYFPELRPALLRSLPARAVVDGEIVIATEHGLDFDLLQLRLHPAASRVAKLAEETPSSFVAFDLLGEGDRDLRDRPQVQRRAALEKALGRASGSVHLTPCSRDRRVAGEWFHRFEGAGLDGVIAKHETTTYQPGKRAMIKVKHARTADCVVAGFRWHKNGPGEMVGSLLLGLYDERGRLHHVGVTSSFTAAMRRQLAGELEPLRKDALEGHPWREWADMGGGSTRMPGGQSRWSQGKDLSWEPLRIERVCEVKYDHLQGDRFRHAAVFARWRPDRRPPDCRYDQLEVTPPAELGEIFGSGGSAS